MRPPINGNGRWKASGSWARMPSRLGLEIAVELEPFHLSIVNNIDKMDRFLHDVGPPERQGEHRYLASGAGEGSARRGSQTLSGESRTCICPIATERSMAICRRDVAWWISRPICKPLASSGFEGTVSIELEYSPEPDKIVDWVRRRISRPATSWTRWAFAHARFRRMK